MATPKEIRENAKRLEAAGAPLEDIEKYVSFASQNVQRSLGDRAMSLVKEFAPIPTSMEELTPKAPDQALMNYGAAPAKPLLALDKYSRQIKDAALEPVEKGMDKLAVAPGNLIGSKKLAIAGALYNDLIAKPLLRLATPFGPTELGGTVSAFMVPNIQEKAIAPNMSKGYMENVIPSSAKVIKHAQKYGKKDAADLVVERPHLGNSRADIRRNAESGIESLENQIQQKLDQAVKAGKLENPPVPNDDFTAMSQKLQAPVELPSGQPIKSYGEPKVGTIQRYAPEEYNFQTAGRKFTKDGQRGLFQPEDPTVEAKQISYLKEQRQSDILKAREAFKKRMSDPEYGYKISKKYAVGRDEIVKGIDDVISEKAKPGTESEAIDALKSLKDQFSKSHPQYADVQYWNDVKRSLYKLVGNKGYLSQAPAAKVEAQIAIANKIKRRIQDIVPEIDGLNNEQGALLEIRDAIIESSPREVRDVSLTGPLWERGIITSARVLSRPRKAANTRAGLTAPVALTYDDDVKDK